MKLLLVTGGRHPYEESTPVLARFLTDAGYEPRVTESGEELGAGLGEYAAVVLNTWRRPEDGNDLSPAQRDGLRSFVAGGGGLVSIHISPASCPDWPEMKKLTGGGWVSGVSNHPPYGTFTVNVRDPHHPCAAGVSDFETEDELYCDLDLQPGIEVFLGALLEGVERPLGWTTAYGKGRVFNIALGHSGRSQENPSFQRLVLNGVGFATGKQAGPAA